MKWLQFLSPVQSMDWQEAISFMDERDKEDVTLLDVRQPGEYEQGHLPGAVLLPLGELAQRASELDADDHIIVYCRSGVRSRSAAQLLKANGFDKVYNLSGGILSWKRELAVGPVEKGLYLFSENPSVEQIILTGYGLETGLHDFYVQMQDRSQNEQAKSLLGKLAGFEIAHRRQLMSLYKEITGREFSREVFVDTLVKPVMEGGLSTEEFLQLYQVDIESEVDVLSMAIAVEAQAYDLYHRAAEKAEQKEVADLLFRIAEEERSHLARLARYIDDESPFL